ncbi:hypothetical protein YPPY13_4356 [Yersinia pestis PY-13]|nr:hypothetical protein YPPY01_4268 [Yersinia pestis PY-01]EIQ97197.1 hypothetical protein YPPY04_4336 [Yersinia pestis PY-04]EIQ98363.1 hypothetical protein YPPY05_4314 [Yersinia pestis PY-05]EIR01681.1 hypothetical protein YPPY06_4373 [Yersinia pestis PY-06]EIR12632.1 hypothetical protein YPPY07_4237 [Yersinia pestis PY-07]EIR14451.1 hypothetical protein YPPY09_4380 [Yersinia pestis PY-09]EIR26938.1 hypothetical protein YPPY10_4381 [Yersinia pestis PY-10]EIR28916.1 hypothetical protein YPP
MGRSPGLSGTGSLRPRHLPPMILICPADCGDAFFTIERFAIGCFAIDYFA